MDTKTPRLDRMTVDGATTIVFHCKDLASPQRADLAGWIATGGPLLAPLRDAKVFGTACIAEYGSAIAWAGDDDLMIDTVHLVLIASEQKPFVSEDAARWQAEAGMSNREAADFLGVALSTWNAYKAGSDVPWSIGMVCRATRRDPLLLQAHFRPRKAGRPRKSA